MDMDTFIMTFMAVIIIAMFSRLVFGG